jgi:transcriptional regulator with XRE-family HTH domain
VRSEDSIRRRRRRALWTPFRIGIGLTLRGRREQLGLSQGALAALVGKGTTQTRIAEWESGAKLIRFNGLLSVCTAARVSMSDVVTTAETYARDLAALRADHVPSEHVGTVESPASGDTIHPLRRIGPNPP